MRSLHDPDTQIRCPISRPHGFDGSNSYITDLSPTVGVYCILHVCTMIRCLLQQQDFFARHPLLWLLLTFYHKHLYTIMVPGLSPMEEQMAHFQMNPTSDYNNMMDESLSGSIITKGS